MQPAPTMFRLRIRWNGRVAVLACLYLTVLSIHLQHGPPVHAEEWKGRRTLQGHADSVFCVAFSPDGKTLASAGFDETIKLWDVAAGKERATLTGHKGGVHAVAFSVDGKTLASASSDETLKLWDVATGKERATLSGQPDDGSVAFSPDGKTVVSGSTDNTIKFWDVATGRERSTLQGQHELVRGLAYSPVGKTLASAAGCRLTVKLWDVVTGKERVVLQGDAGVATSVAFSPDGKTLVSAGYDGKIKLWNVATGKERVALTGNIDTVTSLAFSPDGKTLASAGGEKTIKLWNIPATNAIKSPRSGVLTPKDLNDVWIALGGDEEAQAYQGIETLVNAPDQAVGLVKERWQPVSKVKAQDIAGWITDLDSDQFTDREKAREGLEKAGEQAVAALCTKLGEKPSLEVRRRIDELLAIRAAESLRLVRAVEVLEYVGTAEAKQVLEALATGAEGAKLTEEAKASLARLKKRTSDEK